MSRKEVFTIFLALMMCCVFLNGCSQEEVSSSKGLEDTLDETEKPQDDDSAEEPEESVEAEQKYIPLPEGFIKLTEAEEAELPYADELTEAVEQVLSEIGVKTIEGTVLGNYTNDNLIIILDVYAVVDGDRGLLVHVNLFEYVSRHNWRVFDVHDADTGKYYYVYGKSKEDVYDYITGEISSLASEREVVEEEVPHREGMYGISDKDVFDLGSPRRTFARDKVPNDVTGNWRISTLTEDIQMVDYALSYYKKYFHDKSEVHIIVNLGNKTTTSMIYLSGGIYVTVRAYVEGEEFFDAKKLSRGPVLADYIVYADNGDIEKVEKTE